ncbi:MAG: RNA 2',3'-cyclic phosphodiesterase [Thermoleophilia bacterium]|nr:RNA 2',3'-cyclic phosphodiesterase [Thermoleophilia bacterium]
MSSPASVSGDARLRLFYGLPLPAAVTAALGRWQESALVDARVRPVAAAQLHVTLAFLGARHEGEVPALGRALAEAAAGAGRPVLTPRRYRETARVAMLVLDDENGRAAALQARLSTLLEALGAYRPERRPWLPHVTVGRHRERPRLRPELPRLGPFSPSDAALYHSVLRPEGAQYSILESVSLGG